MSHAALIIFQKNEVLGKVKTRLAASVGAERALEIYRWLIHHTHQEVKELKVDKYLFYSDFIPEENPSRGFQIEIQYGETLGERMSNAFQLLFSRGYTSVVIIGTDCAAIESSDLNRAFLSLSQVDLVIGPARDGGYYLLGMRSFRPELFENVAWSTSKVLETTLDRADSVALEYEFLRILSDIDTGADWEEFSSKAQPNFS